MSNCSKSNRRKVEWFDVFFVCVAFIAVVAIIAIAVVAVHFARKYW